MFGQDGGGKADLCPRIIGVVADLNRISVKLFNIPDAHKVLCVGTARLWIRHKPDGEDEIVRCHLHPVFPKYALFQTDDYAFPVLGHVKALGCPQLQFQVFVVAQGSNEDEVRNLVGGRVRAYVGVEVRGLPYAAKHKIAAVHRSLLLRAGLCPLCFGKACADKKKKHKAKGEVFEQKALGQKLALPACFAHIHLFCCRRIDHFALPVIWSARS